MASAAGRSRVVVPLLLKLFIGAPIILEVLCLIVLVLFISVQCPFQLCCHLSKEERELVGLL